MARRSFSLASLLPPLTMRRVLTYWLLLVQAVVLALVAGGVYWVVYARVDQANLTMLHWQLQHSFLTGHSGPRHFRMDRGRRHEQDFGPGRRPEPGGEPPEMHGPREHDPKEVRHRHFHGPFPDHGDEGGRPHPGDNGQELFGPPQDRVIEAPHLTLKTGTEADWEELADPFVVVRYYDMNAKLITEQGGTASSAGPASSPQDIESMLAKGESSRVHSVFNDSERWLLWDIQVYDEMGKAVGIVEIGKGSRPVDDLLKTLAGALAMASLGGLGLGALLAGPLARRLARPIENMAEVARSVSQGDFRPRALPQGTVEVKAMAGDFNYMIDELASTFQRHKRFIADASHELKTPLTTVASMAELLHDQGDDLPLVRRQRALTLIQNEVQRMSELVGDLLTLSRLEHAPNNAESVEMGKTLREIVASYQVTHGNLELAVAPGVEAKLRLDKDGWTRVVRNLLDKGAFPISCSNLPAPQRPEEMGFHHGLDEGIPLTRK